MTMYRVTALEEVSVSDRRYEDGKVVKTPRRYVQVSAREVESSHIPFTATTTFYVYPANGDRVPAMSEEFELTLDFGVRRA